MFLRDVKPDDCWQIHRWRNLPEVRSSMYTDRQISPEEHQHWFAGIQGDPTRRYWIITDGSRDCGVANLLGIDRRNSRCAWAYYLAEPESRGTGIAAAAEFEVLCYVFDQLQLNKLCCEVLAFNQAARNTHKSFGFVQEGLLRRHVRRSDGFHDVVALALLRDEWLAIRPEMENRLARILERLHNRRQAP